jgi:hypothetical protein
MSDFVKVRSEYPPTVPLLELAMYLAEPAEGWANFLGRRAIAIVPDDLGRDSITRGDARRLLDEQREQVLRQAALRRVAEQEAVEADQACRAQIWQGVPAHHLPPGAAPAAVMLAAARDAVPKRVTPLQEALGGGGAVYHPIHQPAEDES